VDCHPLLLADSYNVDVMRRSKYVKFSKLLSVCCRFFRLLEHWDCSRKHQCNDDPKDGIGKSCFARLHEEQGLGDDFIIVIGEDHDNLGGFILHCRAHGSGQRRDH
jgi:hypothetical protein